MKINKAIATISECYEADRAAELIAAARENEAAAIDLASVLLREVDANGELVRGAESALAISQAEAELEG